MSRKVAVLWLIGVIKACTSTHGRVWASTCGHVCSHHDNSIAVGQQLTTYMLADETSTITKRPEIKLNVY